MPLISVAATVSEVKEVSIPDALIYSALGFGIVFAVLLVLMAFIGIMSKVINIGSKKPAAAPAPISAPAPVSSKPVAQNAPEGAMFVTLSGKRHTVSVTEKLPRFSVTLNGKTHAVDVEEIAEEAAE